VKIQNFLQRHYRHFNAATLLEAAEAYSAHIEAGGSMMMALGGAMSTAELGISLAEMIRRKKIDAITCTGANLEEDLFNLVAHDDYQRIPRWRSLSPADEKNLERAGLNRVTDTCIPEEEAMRSVERPLVELWCAADRAGERYFPHEFLYELLLDGNFEESYQIDPQDSWLLAAAKRNLPMFVPGWEDSTLGNVFTARVLDKTLSSYDLIRSGTESMGTLVDWYLRTTMGSGLDELESIADETHKDPIRARTVATEEAERTVGFFQIGGGIAGDFPICAVPLRRYDRGAPHLCPRPRFVGQT
jgi:deoxyhypusine synthase